MRQRTPTTAETMAGRFLSRAKQMWRRAFNLYERPSPYDDAPPKSQETRVPSPAYVHLQLHTKCATYTIINSTLFMYFSTHTKISVIESNPANPLPPLYYLI